MTRTSQRPALLHGEIILLMLTAAVAGAAYLTATLKGQAVDWAAFAPPILGGLGLVGFGALVRRFRGAERLALLLIGTSIYLTFGAFVAIFIFMFFPISGTPIDPLLMQIDAQFGYSWPDAVAWAANWPAFGKGLGLVYNSSLCQLLAMIAILAFLRRDADLHRFILTGALALLGTLGIWSLVPSFGPAAYLSVPPETEAAINLVVDQAYGALLIDMATNGIAVIRPETIVGSIAFPSYHTVMMCLVVWYARRTPLFWLVLVINIPMVPAILIHGGHHAIDMAGGVLIFALAAAISKQAINPAARSPAFQRRGRPLTP